MAKNVLSTSRDIGNLSRDLNDMSQKPDFQRDYLKLPESCINEKVVGKGLEWCYIGVEWRSGANWLKLYHRNIDL